MKAKSSVIISSIIFLLLGLTLIIWPSVMRKILCYVLGLLVLGFGVFRLICFIKQNPGTGPMTLAVGIICIILGIFILIKADAIAKVFSFVIGLALIADSIFNIYNSIMLKKEGGSWLVYFIASIVLLGIGILLLFDPFTVIDTAMIFGGIFMIINGGIGIYVYLKGE